MSGKYAYFAADVHLGLQVGDPAARERSFVDFLRSIASDADSLYLLGDIWDFWYEYKYVVPKGYVQVFAAIEDLVRSGVKVYFFPGNHDVWAYSYFEELGMIKMTQPALVQIGGKSLCIGHGDGLGPVPFGYRVLRGIFHNRVLQALFSTLHPRIAFSLGYAWSRHNRLARGEKGRYVFKGESEPLYRFAVQFAASHKVDYFVFGHYHVDVDVQIPGGSRLIILKDWLEQPSFWRIPLE
ncbi:MAG: UDP-2,3-diacylglucosamine diphosphatase [Bacteroidales bacterium]|nr:UDP-2,3-diacylglucosamine diphosphatase [Bacteroidales bacterium]